MPIWREDAVTVRLPWSHIKLIALALLLTVLAHDAVMAGDPHLGPTLPNPWYLAHLRTPNWSVAGAAFAGSPVFPIGHNGFACWSVTAGLTDTTDLFLETLSDDGDEWRAVAEDPEPRGDQLAADSGSDDPGGPGVGEREDGDGAGDAGEPPPRPDRD